jgi:hypothetical protein
MTKRSVLFKQNRTCILLLKGCEINCEHNTYCEIARNVHRVWGVKNPVIVSKNIRSKFS